MATGSDEVIAITPQSPDTEPPRDRPRSGASGNGCPLAMAGFDDFELGRQAATPLFQRMDADPAAPRRIVIPIRLVPRGSGELPPDRNRRTVEGN